MAGKENKDEASRLVIFFQKNPYLYSTFTDEKDVSFPSDDTTSETLVVAHRMLIDETHPPTWGDIIHSILTACPSDAIRKQLLHMKWSCPRVYVSALGHSTSLTQSSRMDSIGRPQFGITFGLKHSWTDHIEDPYTAFLAKKSWPPADNYYGSEPISHLRIGVYNDNESCACCEKKNSTYKVEHDNTKAHMIVLIYQSSTKKTEAKRVAFNKHLLLAWLSKTGSEPLARLPVSQEMIDKIDKGTKFEPFQL